MKIMVFILVLFMQIPAFAEAPNKDDLREALKADPYDRLSLYNLGLMNYLEGEYKFAINYWVRLKDLEPNDWHVRAKLIQAYSASKDIENREKEIKEIINKRNSGKYEDLSSKGFFIRDQFAVDDKTIFVFDYYDMNPEWKLGPMIWKFYIKYSNPVDDGLFISLGSYDATTEFSRSMGEIGADERLYHLDGYWESGKHSTYGFYKTKPDYDMIKNQVIDIIKGKKKERSSTTPQVK